jgi:demethylmenaquinone methyltransferase/2-methoxy-6-polyprenyl-1,4-benzoquinol methylase
MGVDDHTIRDLYRKRAKRYDLTVWTYALIGMRERQYRRDAVSALLLSPGDTVLDLGCGTGLNFDFLQRAVKSRGSIIGVDVTDAMLEVARRRVAHEGWRNIELVEADVRDYAFPSGLAGILSTFAMSLVPEFDEVIRRGTEALRAGGRMALFDIKKPDGWPAWMVRFTAWINQPFGVSVDFADRRPWESIARHLEEVLFREYYGGYLYLSVGEAARG